MIKDLNKNTNPSICHERNHSHIHYKWYTFLINETDNRDDLIKYIWQILDRIEYKCATEKKT